MDGSDGRLDMRLSPPFACFHRGGRHARARACSAVIQTPFCRSVGPDSQDSALVVGALANAPLRVPATEAALRAYHSEQGRRDGGHTHMRTARFVHCAPHATTAQ